MYSHGSPHLAGQKQDDQLEHTYSSYVRIRDVALRTCRRRWTIGKSGEKGSRISVLAVRHDDDIYVYIYIYIYIYLCVEICVCVYLGKIGNRFENMKMYRDDKTWGLRRMLKYLPKLNVLVFKPSSGHVRRCPWCNGYRHRIWTRRYEFNSCTRLIAFHIALIPLGKVWIQLFSLQLWVNSRADLLLQPLVRQLV